MNLQDQVIYRCIHAACARPMPRRVDFCPYCGTAQHEGALRPASAAVCEPVPAPEPVSKPVPAPAPPVDTPAFVQQVPPAPAMPAPAAAAPLQPPMPGPAAAAVPPPPPKAAPRAAPSGPALRKPIRLRYWLLALAILAGIWFMARPEPKKFEARIEQAILQAEDCNIKEARAELQALRNDKAGAAQLERLQSSIGAAASACERKRARGAKAKPTPKRDTPAAALKPAVPVLERPVLERPVGQSARNLIAEAERDIARGNYKAASNKLETCIAMVEGSRECAAYKVHADRLLRDMQHCVATGRDWMNERCM
ncbi:hypothetical protein F2P45_09535 [Massilia sp. CCM 8733]|uniref:Uncharacterized protein n=1 Tax=Massilia mucilaginosa TaxID=2609282 RepID=A0ABX0NQT5_9BURK|nr:hypothetical protein [Massilia mucilaginosa]NHZ89253.1 hypothetical protein [Massilia mucilaginosa]